MVKPITNVPTAITDVPTAISALTDAVKAVTTKEASGANDEWFSSLEAKAGGDEEAKKKVETLKFFDGILRSSTQTKVNSTSNSDLGCLVTEIRGYQDLTERFFSDLRALTMKDQPLENAAVKKRNELFQVLKQVQKWSLGDAGGISPSDFGACTNQFLSRMQAGSRELSRTQQLFKNQSLELAESDLKNLADAWGNVVSTFVEDAQDTDNDDQLNIGDPATIAGFLCIHNRLETLYSRLDTNVSLVN
jgi:hypothetical protein